MRDHLWDRFFRITLFVLQEFTIPGSKASVAILFIDTIILAGAIQLLPEEEELPALPPSGPASPRDAEQEWDFINQTLSKWAQSTDQHKWKIVAGHYPGIKSCTVNSLYSSHPPLGPPDLVRWPHY